MRALTILVEDWRGNLENGRAKTPLDEVVQALGNRIGQEITQQLTSHQVADLIYDHLLKIGVLGSALEAVADYQNEEQLLKEKDLLGMLQDIIRTDCRCCGANPMLSPRAEWEVLKKEVVELRNKIDQI